MPEYFAPSFRVDINGSQLAADVSKNIQQISVATKPDSMDTFQLSVINPHPDLRWTHTADADLFEVGASVSIELGYVDDMKSVFKGEITKASPTFPESGMPTISIEGYTRMHWLQGNRKTRTFQQMTDGQIVSRIAQECGLAAQVEDTEVQHEYVMQGNQSDLEFIKSRAEVIHFEILVDDHTLIFRKKKEDGSKALMLVWAHPQRGVAPVADAIPLKSFQPSMNTLEQVGTVIVRGYDPKAKKEVIGKAGIGQENRRMGTQSGAQVAGAAFKKQKEMVRTTMLSSQAEVDQQARALYNDHAMRFVQGSGATIGLPQLRAGIVVELLGLGPRFSGLYYVEEATHTLGAGGYQTTFTVKRNAV